MDLSPMLSIIHIITIGTMLNFKNGNKGHRGLFDNFEIKLTKQVKQKNPELSLMYL